MNRLRLAAPWFVLVVLLGIGAYDLATGLTLLLAAHPERVAPFASLVGLDPTPGVLAVLRRLGAFGVVIGASTVAWAWRSRRDRGLRSTMMVVYMLAGTAFGQVDQRHFAVDPAYLLSKRVVGAVYALALVAHFALRPRDAAASTDRVARGTA